MHFLLSRARVSSSSCNAEATATPSYSIVLTVQVSAHNSHSLLLSAVGRWRLQQRCSARWNGKQLQPPCWCRQFWVRPWLV